MAPCRPSTPPQLPKCRAKDESLSLVPARTASPPDRTRPLPDKTRRFPYIPRRLPYNVDRIGESVDRISRPGLVVSPTFFCKRRDAYKSSSFALQILVLCPTRTRRPAYKSSSSALHICP